MSNARFCPENYIDDVDSGDLTVTPAMETDYPITNVQDIGRDRLARWPSILDAVTHRVSGHWNGNGRRINSFFIFNHLLRGSTVQLVLKRNGSTVYDSGAVTVVAPLVALGSKDWGIAGLGLETSEPLGAECGHSQFFTETACDAFEITFTKCQGHYRQFGRLYLGKYVEAPYNPENGMSFGPASNEELQRLLGGSFRTRAGARWNELVANMIYADAATIAAWRDLLRLCTNRDLAVSLFPGEGGRKERDHIFNGKRVLNPFQYSDIDIARTTLRIMEV